MRKGGDLPFATCVQCLKKFLRSWASLNLTRKIRAFCGISSTVQKVALYLLYGTLSGHEALFQGSASAKLSCLALPLQMFEPSFLLRGLCAARRQIMRPRQTPAIHRHIWSESLFFIFPPSRYLSYPSHQTKPHHSSRTLREKEEEAEAAVALLLVEEDAAAAAAAAAKSAPRSSSPAHHPSSRRRRRRRKSRRSTRRRNARTARTTDQCSADSTVRKKYLREKAVCYIWGGQCPLPRRRPVH